MLTERAPGSLMIRAPGYLALCVGVQLAFLLVSIGAFLDPALDDTRDPDWMFWAWAGALAGLLLRAPFVGLRITDDRVMRRGWVRTRTYLLGDVKTVASQSYSGNLNRGSRSKRFRMLYLKLSNGRIVDVPEVTGRKRTTLDRVAVARSRLDMDL
ncbi:hypothetical protein JNB_09064 [Janibacter sp. HTCC2649]|nr:hypothetical protein JNB_09064 [Janibacter sp. HTCC2649]